jgi:ribosome-binding factor A
MAYRRLRVQDLIRDEVSLIFLRDIRDPDIGLVTVLGVEMTEDLRHAKIVCSIFGGKEEKEKALRALRRSKGYVKFLLGKRIRIKYMPEIEFVLDDSFERLRRIEELLERR